MIIIGINGGMGTGKSYVSKVLFALYDVPIYNCDLGVKYLMNTNGELRKELVDMFGPDCYLDDKTWNRKYVVEIAKKDDTVLNKMGAVIQPYLIKEIIKFKEKSKEVPAIAIESALFNKSKELLRQVDVILNVTAPLETRIKRIKERDPFRTDSEIIMLLYNQLSTSGETQLPKPEYTITNIELENEDQLSTEEQLKVIYFKLIGDK